ncbi:chemotaxis protein CheC [Rhodocyclaceae bacterium]
MIEVSELQRDALGEIFNIGVGRAAASLSQIVRDEIELTAPTIQLVVPSEVERVLQGREFDHLSMVSQEFSGPFDARAVLVFPEQNALRIVGQMLGGVVPPEQLGEFEQEAMCEVGNIILNACISALADLFRVEFEGSLPSYEHAERDSLDLFGSMDNDVPVILVVQIDLIIRQQSIRGHLLFLLSVSSLDELLRSINCYLETLGLE